jgi:hypothetical protein
LDHYNDTSGKPYNINYSFGELINNADQYATLAEMIGKCDEVMYLGASQKTESMVTPVFATPILTTSWLA